MKLTKNEFRAVLATAPFLSPFPAILLANATVRFFYWTTGLPFSPQDSAGTLGMCSGIMGMLAFMGALMIATVYWDKE